MVVDENQRVIGIISLSDLLQYLVLRPQGECGFALRTVVEENHIETSPQKTDDKTEDDKTEDDKSEDDKTEDDKTEDEKTQDDKTEDDLLFDMDSTIENGVLPVVPAVDSDILDSEIGDVVAKKLENSILIEEPSLIETDKIALTGKDPDSQ